MTALWEVEGFFGGWVSISLLMKLKTSYWIKYLSKEYTYIIQVNYVNHPKLLCHYPMSIPDSHYLFYLFGCFFEGKPSNT